MEELNVYQIEVGSFGAVLTDRITVLASDFPAAFEKAKKYCKDDGFDEEPDVLSIVQVHTISEV